MGVDMNDRAFKLGKAFALGLAFSRGANCAAKIAMDAQRWITVFPNGRQNEGRPALIDSDTGKVLGGMGGKFNGVDIRKTRKEYRDSGAQTESQKLPEVRSGHEHLMAGQSLKIVRETEKAVLVDNPAFSRYWDNDEIAMAKARGEKQQIWLPKSQISIHEGQVVGMPGWLASRSGFQTVEAEEANKKAFEAGKAKYEQALQEAKQLGIPGIREGMRLETIRDKIREFKVSHKDQFKEENKLETLLNQGRLWEKGDYSRTYLTPKATAEFLGIKFKMHPKKRNIPESVETGDPDRRFTPSAANDLYRALEDVYFDNKSKKFVLPTGLRNMRGWLPEWLEKRFQDAMK